jgi:flagellar biosynthesis/type III secretory pathway protein FliH
VASNAFVPLGIYLTPPLLEATRDESPTQSEATPPEERNAVVSDECEAAIAAARRFRAGLGDALESAVPDLLGSIAREVLARELALGPVDITAIVADAIDACAQTVLSISVHPDDLEAARRSEIAAIADAGLKRGDLRLQLHSGTIDLRLAARLDAVLAQHGM